MSTSSRIALIALIAGTASTAFAAKETASTEEKVAAFDVIEDGTAAPEVEDDRYTPQAEDLVEYEEGTTPESMAKQAGPGGSTSIVLNGDFLNADLDSDKNTYGVGQTASGNGYFAKVSSGGQLIWDIQFSTASGEVVAHDVSVNEDDHAYVAVTSYYPSRAASTQSRCKVFKFDLSTGFIIGSGGINGGTGHNECTRIYARDSNRHYYTAGHFAGSGWMIIGYGYNGMNQLPHQSYYGGWNDVYEIVDVNEDAHGNLMMAINVDNGTDSDIAVLKYETGILNLYNADTRLDYGASGDEDVATGFTVSRNELPHLSGITVTSGGAAELFHKQISVTSVQTRTEATREP